ENLGSANIFDLNPLCKNGLLIVYSNRILCLEKVIAIYEKCGE
ncbi:1288_t:CDS:1, partial [Racocetra fulgida]